jgi:hypothetical protein
MSGRPSSMAISRRSLPRQRERRALLEIMPTLSLARRLRAAEHDAQKNRQRAGACGAIIWKC